eukprot:4713270-Pyramimonas_sp.AAC.1
MNSVRERSRRRRRFPSRSVKCTVKNNTKNTTQPPTSNAHLRHNPTDPASKLLTPDSSFRVRVLQSALHAETILLRRRYRCVFCETSTLLHALQNGEKPLLPLRCKVARPI